MHEMIYKKIPCVDKPVSSLFYGAATDPIFMGEDCDELLDSIYQLGVTAFDTARVYNLSEATLGKWMEKRELRDKLVILSKCGHHSETGKRVNRKEMEYDLKTSLKELRTDYIDIFLLHRDDPDIEVGIIVETFNEMHEKGHIGAFGGSNWTHDRIEEVNEYAYKHNLIPFTVSSPYFGLARQIEDHWYGGVSISGKENQKAREWYTNQQMPVIAYSSLGRGLFSGRIKSNEFAKAGEVLDSFAMKGYGYEENFERLRRAELLAKQKRCSVSQLAMAWIFSQKINTFAIVGTTSAVRMQENIDALYIKLSDKEISYLDLITENVSDII